MRFESSQMFYPNFFFCPSCGADGEVLRSKVWILMVINSKIGRSEVLILMKVDQKFSLDTFDKSQIEIIFLSPLHIRYHWCFVIQLVRGDWNASYNDTILNLKKKIAWGKWRVLKDFHKNCYQLNSLSLCCKQSILNIWETTVVPWDELYG